jgi:hypothetical protein
MSKNSKKLNTTILPLPPNPGYRYEYVLKDFNPYCRDNVFATMGERGYLYVGEAGGAAVFMKAKP